MIDVEEQVRSQVEAFVAELAVLVRQAAVEAVEAQFRGEARAPVAKEAAVAKAPSAGPKAPASTPVHAGRPASKVAPAKARKAGQKRDPAELAKLVERLAQYIDANPGQRMEQIIPALGVPRSELALPMRKLIASHRVTSKGEKRGTVYTPK
jgi:hypothetical protein